MYGLILTDYDHDVYATLIKDKVVWDWMHQQVQFPPGMSSVVVQAPAGYTFEDGGVDACITIGSADNDLWIYAQELTRIDGDQTVVALDANSMTQAVKALLAHGVTEANTIEGLIY